MMFGYACCETGALMPLPITLANRLTRKLEQVRREKLLPYLLPDGKAQVSVEYEDGKPKRHFRGRRLRAAQRGGRASTRCAMRS